MSCGFGIQGMQLILHGSRLGMWYAYLFGPSNIKSQGLYDLFMMVNVSTGLSSTHSLIGFVKNCSSAFVQCGWFLCYTFVAQIKLTAQEEVALELRASQVSLMIQICNENKERQPRCRKWLLLGHVWQRSMMWNPPDFPRYCGKSTFGLAWKMVRRILVALFANITQIGPPPVWFCNFACSKKAGWTVLWR